MNLVHYRGATPWGNRNGGPAPTGEEFEMPAMFQRRPVLKQILNECQKGKGIEGGFYSIKQEKVEFGQDAKDKRVKRTVVVMSHDSNWAFVLPTTSDRTKRWFCIEVGSCLGARGRTHSKDSWVCPWVHTISYANIDGWICTLTPFCNIKLTQWLRDWISADS